MAITKFNLQPITTESDYSNITIGNSKDKVKAKDDKIKQLYEEIKKLKEDKEKLIIQLVDMEELKDENKILRESLDKLVSIKQVTLCDWVKEGN